MEQMTRVNSASACPNVLQSVAWPSHSLHHDPGTPSSLPRSLTRVSAWRTAVWMRAWPRKCWCSWSPPCKSRGVLHRDIKLENLLISTAPHGIKLLDFGCRDLLNDSAYRSFADWFALQKETVCGCLWIWMIKWRQFVWIGTISVDVSGLLGSLRYSWICWVVTIALLSSIGQWGWRSTTSHVFPSEPHGGSPPKADCSSLESCLEARDSKHSEVPSVD